MTKKNVDVGLAYGFGYNSGGEHKTTMLKSKKFSKPYFIWRGILERAYCQKYKKKNPTYADVTVCEEWLDFQVFAEWYVNNEFYGLGYHLDKDILSVNNNLYSPKTCCLVPQEINKLMNGYARGRGQHPIGVSLKKDKGVFSSSIRVDGKSRHLGYFTSPQDAHRTYIRAKTENIRRMADKWRGRIDDRVYLMLSSWDFSERASENKWGLI